MDFARSKRLIPIIAIAFIALGIIGCHSYAPNAGHEIVLIKKPIFFGHGGVSPDPVKTGRTYAAISTDGVDVNMQPQKYETELPDTMTKDGVPITFHAIMVLQVTDSVNLIKTFGPEWYANNLEEPFKTMVRQAVRKRGMNETAISTTALDDIDNEIHDQLSIFMKQKSLPIELVTMDRRQGQSSRLRKDAANRDCHPGAAHPDRTADEACRRSTRTSRDKPRQGRQRLPGSDGTLSPTVHPTRNGEDAARSMRRTRQIHLHLYPKRDPTRLRFEQEIVLPPPRSARVG